MLRKIRNLYLDDLIDKEGISGLQRFSEVPIWPTPAVVNLAFEQIARDEMKLQFPVPCLVLDIGGATTDAHFSLELVEPDGTGRLSGFRSSNRHVFTDLGVFASRESTIQRLSANDGLLEFLGAIYGPDTSRVYMDFCEGTVDEALLFNACFYLALDSLSRKDDNSPCLSISKLSSVVITGGGAQRVNAEVLSRITKLLLPATRSAGIPVFLDQNYEIWVEGMKRC